MLCSGESHPAKSGTSQVVGDTGLGRPRPVGTLVVSGGGQRASHNGWKVPGPQPAPQAAVLVHSCGDSCCCLERLEFVTHLENHAQQQPCVHPSSEDGLPTGEQKQQLPCLERGTVHKFGFSAYMQLMPGPWQPELWPLTYGWQSGRNYEELEIIRKAKKQILTVANWSLQSKIVWWIIK